MEPSNGLSCEIGSFSQCCNPHRFLQLEVLRPSFPALEPWVAPSVSLPVVTPHLLAHKCGISWPASCQLVMHPCCPSFPSPPLLPVWMNVSLLPWLLDFHTVQFSVSSDCFLFSNWLLSFFWLCKDVKHIYVCLHLGQKLFSYLLIRSRMWCLLNTF